jgi:hypothetical protein
MARMCREFRYAVADRTYTMDEDAKMVRIETSAVVFHVFFGVTDSKELFDNY